MKNVLLLTASTGEGHNQAAESLKDVFIAKGFNTIKFDFLKESDTFLNIFISDGYKLLASTYPKLYGNLYKMSNIKKFNTALLKMHFSKIENKIIEMINTVKPDIIVGTHPFAVSVVSDLKDKGIIDIPFISIVTDFKAHYAYIDKHVDAYITGSEYTKQSLLEKNIESNKVFSYGIPIKKDFLYTNLNVSKAYSDYFTILLMGGSMGLKSIGKILKKLTLNRNNIKVIVVCGSNSSLKKELEDKYSCLEFENIKIDILGYTKEIPKLMEMSNVIITKPGGLTTSEAIVKKLPMIIPFVIPGQEQENMEFLVKSGAAIEVDDLKDLNVIVNRLIDDPVILKRMQQNMSKLSKDYSIDNIVLLSKKLAERNMNAYFSTNDHSSFHKSVSMYH